MKTWLSGIFIFCVLWGHSQSISTYNQTWISGAWQKNYKKWNFRCDGSYRSIEWFKYNRQFLIREISTYKFSKSWQAGAGPCWSWQYPYYGVKPVLEFRPTMQVTYSIQRSEKSKFEKNHFEFSARFRGELRYFKQNDEFSSAYLRSRFAVRSSFPLSEELSLQPQLEAMWQKNPGSSLQFSTGRMYIGFNYKIGKMNYQIGYMFQFLERNSGDEIDNNYLLNVSN